MSPRRALAVLLLAASSLAVAPAKPAHLALAERMVAEVLPANNSYANGPYTVTWAGVNGKTRTFNKSDCTTFVTALLKASYGFSAEQFDKWFGKSSPALARYYDAAADNDGLAGFKQIARLQPGDLLISKYTSKAVAAGHMMIVDAPPELVRTTGSVRDYDVTIIDCTGSPHSRDTHTKPQSGVGRGTIRVQTDLSGDVVGWGWSTVARVLGPSVQPMIFAKVPPAGAVATASR